MANPKIYYAGLSDYNPSDGAVLEFPHAQDNPHAIGDYEHETTKSRTLGGSIRASQAYPGRRKFSLPFSLIDETFRAAFELFINTVRGRLYPFHYQATDGTVYYVRLVNDYNPVAGRMYGQSDIPSLEMEEIVGAVPPPALRYLFASRADGYIDTIEVTDLSNPDIINSTGLGLTNTPVAQIMLQDSRYLYLKAFNNITQGPNKSYIIDWATDPANLDLRVTLNDTGLVNAGPACGDLIVRRTNATYNNLMFGWDNANQLTCWDITDPESPSLLDTIALPSAGEGLPAILAFDASTGRLYFGFDRIPGNGTKIAYVEVSSGGLFSGVVTADISLVTNYLLKFGVIFQNQYWEGPGDPQGRSLSDLSVGAGFFFFTANVLKPLVWNNHLVIGVNQSDASYYPVTIFDNTTPYPAIVGHIGSLGGVIGCMAMSGNYLFTCEGSSLKIYDLSDPTAPNLLSTTTLPAAPLALSSYPASGWDGNNGLCTRN